MAVSIAPLSWRTPIVNPDDGTPSSFFIRLWQGLFSSRTIVVNSDRQTIKYNSVGTPTPSSQTTTFTTIKSDNASTVMWTITDSNGNSLSPVTTYLSADSGDSVTMTRGQFDAAIAVNSTTGVKVIATVTEGGKSYAAFAAVNKVSDGSAGSAGADALTVANFVSYTDFAMGLKGWSAGVVGGTAVAGYPLVGTSAGKSFYKYQGESFSGGSRFFIIVQTTDAYFFAVAGQRYAIQTRIESQDLGGTVANNYLRVRWYDSAGSFIREDNVQTLAGAQTFGTLMSGFTTAPAGAIKGAFALYVDTGTTGRIGLAFYEASIAAVSATTSVLPVYVPGQNDPVADQTSVNTAANIAGQGNLATLNTTSATQIDANAVTNYTVTTAANPTFNSGTSPTALSYILSKPSDTYLVSVTATGTMKITGTSGTPVTNLQVYGRVNDGVTIFGRLDVNENVSGTTIYRQFNFTNSYPAASLTDTRALDIVAVLSSSGGTYDVQFLYTQIVVAFFKR